MLHHMYSVGLDVDTKVSWIIVILLIIIRPYAGTYFKPKSSIEKILKEKICMVKLDLKMTYLNFKSLKNLVNKNKELSAGNLDLLSNQNNDSNKANLNLHTRLDKDWHISDHLDKHRKPDSKDEFSHYLAGLIEGDGNIGSDIIEIDFNLKDISTAFYIKKTIGYGKVVKEKSSVKYIVRHIEGIKKILDLVNGKFLAQNNIDKLAANDYVKMNSIKILPKQVLDISNYWLAGFTDALGSFDILDYTDNTNMHILLRFFITGKNKELLSLIHQTFQGKLIDLNNGLYTYSSEDYPQAKNFINYFDKYHLLNSSVNIKYFKWRKVYRIIQRDDHLKQENLSKIKKYQENLRD